MAKTNHSADDAEERAAVIRIAAALDQLEEPAFEAATRQIQTYASLPRDEGRIWDLVDSLARKEVLPLDINDTYLLLLIVAESRTMRRLSPQLSERAIRRLNEWIVSFRVLVDQLIDMYRWPHEWRRITVRPVYVSRTTSGSEGDDLLRIQIEKYREEQVMFEMLPSSYAHLIAVLLEELTDLPAESRDKMSEHSWTALQTAIKNLPLRTRAGHNSDS